MATDQHRGRRPKAWLALRELCTYPERACDPACAAKADHKHRVSAGKVTKRDQQTDPVELQERFERRCPADKVT